jgi:hypothetical protein
MKKGGYLEKLRMYHHKKFNKIKHIYEETEVPSESITIESLIWPHGSNMPSSPHTTWERRAYY